MVCFVNTLKILEQSFNVPRRGTWDHRLNKVSAMSRSRPQSVAIAVTHSPAAAFGEDIADDQYSVSELSHVEDEKRAKRIKGHPGLQLSSESKDVFLRTTLSRAPAGLERIQSYISEEDAKRNSSSSSISPPDEENGHTGGSSGVGGASDSSQERSWDDSSAEASVESDDSEMITSVSSFATFAKTKFQMKTSPTYCCAALPQPLLYKEDRGDFLASLASWVLILRIMGDMPDQDFSESLRVSGELPPVISRVRSNFKTKYTKKDVEDAQIKYSELFKDPTGTDTRGVPFLSVKSESMLEKVQYVCCLGIYRPELRDELYCQLCKQLSNNPSRNSIARGWVLLHLFAGSFAPSEKFAPYFTSFLLEGPSEFAIKVDHILRRTCTVGTRGYPPSWLEFQAAKNNKPILVPVTFMNGFRTLCEVDNATSVRELIHNIAEIIGLQDSSGYSIYITLHSKISCLGHGLHRVLDAIAECEQHTKQMGMRESNSLWRLFFRREYFTPWHKLDSDGINTDLIYQQEEVLILLAAQRYYIDHSTDTEFEKLDAFMRSWMANETSQKQDISYYVDRVREFLQNNFLVTKPSHESLKQDIVSFAKDKWFLLFSRFYDATKAIGPGIALSKVIVGLNNKGVYVMDDTDTVRTHIAFWEIGSVTKGRQNATIRTLKGEDYLVTSQHADDFYFMLTSFIEGLRLRSRYAVVIQDSTLLDGSKGVYVVRGDLITLDKPCSDYEDSALLRGKCQRTSTSHELPRNILFILATSVEPSPDMLGLIVMQLRKDPTTLMCDMHYKPHTLQLYSHQHFRTVSENAVTKLLQKASLKRDKGEAVWQHTREPMKKPLLKRVCSRESLRRPSCKAFAAIQQYMGDLTLKQNISNSELANEWIINPARRNKYLREEIFCQLIKQLTNNPDRTSEEKGWYLMTLLCSTMAPSGELYEQTLGFLKGSKQPPARKCLQLLAAHKTHGSRLYAPHTLEHEMVTKGQANVRVTVMLPSGSSVTVEVDSRTRVSDMKREIKSRLKLNSVAEYSIYLSSREGLHCISDRSFYFDCLSQAEVYWLRSRRSSAFGGTSSTTSNVVMLKKIWVNVNPGEDLEADKYFHFPQELPNFLRGYHGCNNEQTIRMAAFLYRHKFGNDVNPFNKFSEIAPNILPRGFPEDMSLDDVKKRVEHEYYRNKGVTQDEARTYFLQEVSSLPTYGSVVFEVKQRTVSALPKFCLIAINTSGVHVIDLTTKVLLRTFEFSKIPNWAYDDSSFTLIIMSSSNTSRLLLETNLGHNLDDVLMSHISWVMNTQMKRKHGFFNNVGESLC